MPQALTFSTLNLQNFTAPPFASYEFDNIYSQAQWRQKTSWLSRLLQQVQPDMLALQEVFSLAELSQLLRSAGFDVEPSIGDDFGAELRAAIDRWTRVIREAKIPRE